ERCRRHVLAAHVPGLADDELVAALPAIGELVELADRGHLDLDRGLRAFRRGPVRMRLVAPLARLGHRLELGEAVAHADHSTSLPGYFSWNSMRCSERSRSTCSASHRRCVILRMPPNPLSFRRP